MKKHLLIGLIALLAIFSFVSCGGDITLPEDNGSTEKPELVLDESGDLKAWENAYNANKNLKNKKYADINIKVSGTVTAIDDSALYITDENGRVLLINARRTVNPEVGDKVTVEANKIYNYFDAFEIQSKHSTITKNGKGATITPRAITTRTEFTEDGLGIGIKLDYVTVQGRVVDKTASGNYIINIEAKTPENFNGYEDPTSIKKDNAKAVSVRPKGDVSLNVGDYCVFTGHMGQFMNEHQLNVFSVNKLYTQPKAPSKVATFAEWNEAVKSREAKTFTKSLEVTGVVVYKYGTDLYLMEETVADGAERIVVHCKMSTEVPEEAVVGKTLSVILYDVAFSDDMARCTDYKISKVHDKESISIDTINSWAKEYTDVATLKALVKDGSTVGFNPEFIKVSGTINEKTDSGVYVDLSDTRLYCKNSHLNKAEGDTVTVYGFLGSNGKTETAPTPRIINPIYK